jgi:hypothetical protein
MAEAFRTHQGRDKGLGPAAGPDASDLLGAAFTAAGYTVFEADSAWRLEDEDSALIAELAHGFAQAVRETGAVPADVIASWAAVARTGALVGHADLLALPPR